MRGIYTTEILFIKERFPSPFYVCYFASVVVCLSKRTKRIFCYNTTQHYSEILAKDHPDIKIPRHNKRTFHFGSLGGLNTGVSLYQLPIQYIFLPFIPISFEKKNNNNHFYLFIYLCMESIYRNLSDSSFTYFRQRNARVSHTFIAFFMVHHPQTSALRLICSDFAKKQPLVFLHKTEQIAYTSRCDSLPGRCRLMYTDVTRKRWFSTRLTPRIAMRLWNSLS